MTNKESTTQINLSDETISVIEYLTSRMTQVLQRPLYFFDEYKDAVHYVESCEVVLQNLWGFPYNPDYQTYRFKFKDCCCPKTDNFDCIGTGRWYYHRDCPVHEHLFKDKA